VVVEEEEEEENEEEEGEEVEEEKAEVEEQEAETEACFMKDDSTCVDTVGDCGPHVDAVTTADSGLSVFNRDFLLLCSVCIYLLVCVNRFVSMCHECPLFFPHRVGGVCTSLACADRTPDGTAGLCRARALAQPWEACFAKDASTCVNTTDACGPHVEENGTINTGLVSCLSFLFFVLLGLLIHCFILFFLSFGFTSTWASTCGLLCIAPIRHLHLPVVHRPDAGWDSRPVQDGGIGMGSVLREERV
jgi:hypothetical protein